MRIIAAILTTIFLSTAALAATNTVQVPAPSLAPATVERAVFCDPQLDMSNWRHAARCEGKIGEVVSYSETVDYFDLIEDFDFNPEQPGDE